MDVDAIDQEIDTELSASVINFLDSLENQTSLLEQLLKVTSLKVISPFRRTSKQHCLVLTLKEQELNRVFDFEPRN